jgi:hypothetical protein
MNERIRELKAKALVSISKNGYTSWVFNEDKFAELIIRECANIVDSHKGVALPGEPGRSVNGNDLKEHFGIEE